MCESINGEVIGNCLELLLVMSASTMIMALVRRAENGVAVAGMPIMEKSVMFVASRECDVWSINKTWEAYIFM